MGLVLIYKLKNSNLNDIFRHDSHPLTKKTADHRLCLRPLFNGLIRLLSIPQPHHSVFHNDTIKIIINITEQNNNITLHTSSHDSNHVTKVQIFPLRLPDFTSALMILLPPNKSQSAILKMQS